ncbi:glutathione S-transferase family protein [Pararhizobium sp.]|uniref:glutathione S-transferase family protein n=1 Tax=Pararhizobium sp. TaxID=1977563 RepID=UPI00271AA849|nr:glutathione S-transferase [Pararhizobium sp.]MDO9418791.1 glutathione S-transferase [Pararhizobium sp.]
MLTLIHAPKSRSTRIIWLLEELGADYEIRYVNIVRRDGSGGPDDNNPHPHKQVPALLHDDVLVTETIAVVQYLTDLFPGSELGRGLGHPERGAYLSWLAYYGGVIEPAVAAKFEGSVATNPRHAKLYESMTSHVIATLTEQPYLLGQNISAADLILASALMWVREAMPESTVLDRYVELMAARPALKAAWGKDAKPEGHH